MKKFSKVLALLMCLIMIMGTGSAFMINAQAATAAPTFALKETAKEGNVVTYEFQLKSGGFGALDFHFVTSSGVTCNSITIASGLMGVQNPQNGKVSLLYSASPAAPYETKGAVVTAKFTVPASGSYTITADVESCADCNANDITSSVKVEGNSQSWFAKLIAAIVSFFQAIVNFFSGLFA